MTTPHLPPHARVNAHRRHRSLGSLDMDTLPTISRAQRLTVITASCREEGESSGDEGGITEEKVVMPPIHYVPLTAALPMEPTRQPSSLAARRAGTDARKALTIKAAYGNYRSRQSSAEGIMLSPSIAVTPPASAAVLNWTLPSPGLESPVTFASAHRRRLTEPLSPQQKKHVAPPSLAQLVEWRERRQRSPPSPPHHHPHVVTTVFEESSESTSEDATPSPSIRIEFHDAPSITPPLLIKPKPTPTNKGTQSVARAACARRLVSTLSRRAGGGMAGAPPTIAVA